MKLFAALVLFVVALGVFGSKQERSQQAKPADTRTDKQIADDAWESCAAKPALAQSPQLGCHLGNFP